jgi:hypothetical protein
MVHCRQISESVVLHLCYLHRLAGILDSSILEVLGLNTRSLREFMEWDFTDDYLEPSSPSDTTRLIDAWQSVNCSSLSVVGCGSA